MSEQSHPCPIEKLDKLFTSVGYSGKLLNPLDVNNLRRLSNGGQSRVNHVLEGTLNDQTPVIVKFCNSNWKRRKTLTEISALTFLKHNTTIPVPRILGYELNAETSPVGKEYIILERLEGTCWAALDTSEAETEAIVAQIMGYLEQLRQYKSDKMGTFRLTCDGKPVAGVLTELHGNLDYPNPTNFHDYIRLFCRSYGIRILQKWGQLREIQSVFCSYFERIMALLEPQVLSRWVADYNGAFVLSHQDLVRKNIMVHHGQVTGMLDWEWAAFTMPEMDYLAGADFITSDMTQILMDRVIPMNVPEGRKQAYKLISLLFGIHACDEWKNEKITNTARFLWDKQEQKELKNNETPSRDVIFLKLRELGQLIAVLEAHVST